MDFNELLDKQIDSVERPPAKPPGTYLLRVTKMPEQKKSREKETPGLEFTFAYVKALADVDPDMLEGFDLSKGTLRDTFWLTDDSIFRLREFLERAGMDAVSGRSRGCCWLDHPDYSRVPRVTEQTVYRCDG